MSSISLQGDCTIYEIAQIQQQIDDNWKEGTDIDLNVSAVLAVDVTFVQLLASCKETAKENEHAFKVTGPTKVLTEKIEAVFMQDYFVDVMAFE
jgi:ABC-type transporter Mla MlaB component